MELAYGTYTPEFIHLNGQLYVVSYDKSSFGEVYEYHPPAVPGDEGTWSPVYDPNDDHAFPLPVTPTEFKDIYGISQYSEQSARGTTGGPSVRRGGGRGGGPTSRATTAPGTILYILDEYGRLVQFDPGSNTEVATLDFNNFISGGAAISLRLALTPDGNFAFITAQSSLPSNAQGSASVLIADLNTFSIVSTITLPVSASYVPWSPAVAITPDGTLAYVVTQPFSGTGPSNVFVINVATRQITMTIPVQADSHLGNIAIAPDGTKAYLVDSLDTSAFLIQVLDLQSNTLDTPISIFPTTLNNEIGPSYIALHPDGTRLYFLPLTGGPVQVVSLVTKAVTETIPVATIGTAPSFGSQPSFTPDGNFLMFMSGPNLMVWVNTLTDTVDSTITFAPPPDGAIRNTGFFYVPGP